MSLMDILAIISFVVGIISIVLAIYAMAASSRSEQRSKENFDRTQEMIRQFYDRTKELLNDIDRRTSVMEKVVLGNQEHLMNTMTNIVNETVLPKKQDAGEQFGMMFMQQLFTNPKDAAGIMETLKPLMEMAELAEKSKKR